MMTQSIQAALDYVEQRVEARIPTTDPEMEAALLTLAGAVVRLVEEHEDMERVVTDAMRRMYSELEQV